MLWDGRNEWEVYKKSHGRYHSKKSPRYLIMIVFHLALPVSQFGLIVCWRLSLI